MIAAMNPLPDILILCGGRATRLGGAAKPLASFAGRPLIEQVIAALPAGARLLISANAQAADYACYAPTVLDDGVYRDRGPLAGLLAGLADCRSDTLLCVPGDAPRLPRTLLHRLAAARAEAGAAIAYAHDGHGPQPLCCLVERTALASLRDYLDSGGSTPREWFAQLGAVEVRFDDTPRWGWSLNTPEEWSAAEAALAATTLPP
jgi:molybdopterin-guanine dinucleotide biosynthesis protein A